MSNKKLGRVLQREIKEGMTRLMWIARAGQARQGRLLDWLLGLALVGYSWTWRTGEFEIDWWG